jgi:urea transport system substrate-binding protein
MAPSERRRAFLVALRECVLAHGFDHGVPSWVSKDLSKRSGEDAEAPTMEPVRVGILHSFTGNMAISERSLLDAAELAIDEINQAGGVLGRKLVAKVEDGGSDPKIFAEKARKLIEQTGVCTIFGCWASDTRKAVLPVLRDHDHLLWYPVQYEGKEQSPHVIYTGATPNQQILPALEWSLEKFGPRAFLVGSDYVFPREANALIKSILAERGCVLAGEEYRDRGDKSFGEVVRRIAEAKPDFIFNTVNGDSNVALFYELQKAGIGARVMSVSIAEDELRSIGTQLTEGHYCAWTYFQSIDTCANRRFVESFKRVFGMERVTDDPIEAAYFQVHLFALAVAKANSTEPRAVRAAARGLSFDAPGGVVCVDPENQHTWKQTYIGKILPTGQFSIEWHSREPIRPQPFGPDTVADTGGAAGLVPELSNG